MSIIDFLNVTSSYGYSCGVYEVPAWANRWEGIATVEFKDTNNITLTVENEGCIPKGAVKVVVGEGSIHFCNLHAPFKYLSMGEVKEHYKYEELAKSATKDPDPSS